MSCGRNTSLEKARFQQEQEAFKQIRKQHELWFKLRLLTGYTAVAMLVIIALCCFWIIFNNIDFPQEVVSSAGAAIFLDVLGLCGALWKVILSPNSTHQLRSTVTLDESL